MLRHLFKRVRETKGLSRYKMARLLNISQTQLNHYENQPVTTREGLLVKLHEISGLTLDEFWQLLKKEVKTSDHGKIKARELEI